jgi:hypothetical protein
MDYYPKTRAARYLWWKNLSARLLIEGPKMGLTAPQAAAATAVADEAVAKMEARDAADAQAAGALVAESAALTATEVAIRAAIRNWKTLPPTPPRAARAR